MSAKFRLTTVASSLALILVVAFAARAGFAWEQERKIPRDALAIVPFAQEAGNIAYALATGQGFSAPFRNNTGPTAWLAPVYPFILSIIFRLFGALSIPALNAAIFLNIICSTATCVPIFYLGRRLGGVAVGATGAWFWALFPAAVMLPFEWIWDTSLSALLAALLLWATICVAESVGRREWCLYGLLWGFALLTNVALGALFLPWLLWAGYRVVYENGLDASGLNGDRCEGRNKEEGAATSAGQVADGCREEMLRGVKPQEKGRGLKPGRYNDVAGVKVARRWRLATMAGVIAVLCCVPWSIRNYVQFHRIIPVRSSFSFELWSGNNNIFDPHTGNAMARITLYGEVRQYTQLGENGYMQDKWRKATLFIRTHPELESKLLLGRVIATWLGTQRPFNDFMETDSRLSRAIFLINALLLLGTCAGIVLLYRRRDALWFPVAAAPILFPIVYYIAHTSLRYRHPLDPILILLTALSLMAPFTGARKKRRSDSWGAAQSLAD